MKRIIVCDDEPHIVEGLRYLLRGSDRQIDVARNGSEAVAMAEASPPDLLIIDVMMPEMSGLEAIAILRKKQSTKDIPIIILTAKNQAQDDVMAQKIWGARVMPKPFQPYKLRELVQTLLEARPSVLQSSI